MSNEFPAQKASNAENASIWWRHHVDVRESRPSKGCWTICPISYNHCRIYLSMTINMRPSSHYVITVDYSSGRIITLHTGWCQHINKPNLLPRDDQNYVIDTWKLFIPKTDFMRTLAQLFDRSIIRVSVYLPMLQFLFQTDYVARIIEHIFGWVTHSFHSDFHLGFDFCYGAHHISFALMACMSFYITNGAVFFVI